MAKVRDNRAIGEDVYMLSVEYSGKVKMGQFFMIRSWDFDPLLSRPISVFDWGEGEVKFLYQIRGRGTNILSKLKKGHNVTLHGPYGNGYPYLASENIALVGGGMGAAPLYYATRELNRVNPDRKINVYLGFRRQTRLIEVYQKSFPNVKVNIGGYITDDINYSGVDAIFTCGPEVMMRKLFEKSKQLNIDLYASVEERMACGVGACLGCTCNTVHGNKRTCKDGPVFLGEDIFYEQTGD